MGILKYFNQIYVFLHGLFQINIVSVEAKTGNCVVPAQKYNVHDTYEFLQKAYKISA